MSKFAVEVRSIERVEAHPNADKLELAYLKGLGFQFVVGKGEFTPGGTVVYFPIDSVLPAELAERLGLAKPRVRTIKLRGAFSEGFLVPIGKIGLDSKLVFGDGQDLTASLGVVKYEPPYNGASNKAFSRPEHLYPIPVRVYDLENAQNFPHVVTALQDVMVVVTEKLEGSNWWARITRNQNWITAEGVEEYGYRVEVGQRRFGIKAPDRIGLHPWWDCFYRQDLDIFLYALAREYPGYDITLRGEVIGAGVQGNYYGLKGQMVYLYDIELDEQAVDAVTFQGLTHKYGVATVPTVFIGKLRDLATDTVAFTAASNGASAMFEPPVAPKLREGIVVRPLEAEMRDALLGRVIVKARDPIYLAQ